MWKKFDRVNNPQRACFGDINLVTAVVLECRPDIPALQSVWRPCSPLCGFLMEDDFGSRRGQWGSVEVKVAKDMLVGAEMRVNPRFAQ